MFQTTQTGRVILASFLVGIILLSISIKVRSHQKLKKYRLLHGLVFLILILMILTSYNLKITIGEKDLSFQFGPGLIQKTILLETIIGCEPVKNNRRMGFGIRKIKSGRLYNVSGLDAIELTLTGTNKVTRIGTYEPIKVCEELMK